MPSSRRIVPPNPPDDRAADRCDAVWGGPALVNTGPSHTGTTKKPLSRNAKRRLANKATDFVRGIEALVTEVVEQWLQTLADPRAHRLLYALYVEQDPAQVAAAAESLRDHPLGGGKAVLDSFYEAVAIALDAYFIMLGEEPLTDLTSFADELCRQCPRIMAVLTAERVETVGDTQIVSGQHPQLANDSAARHAATGLPELSPANVEQMRAASGLQDDEPRLGRSFRSGCPRLPYRPSRSVVDEGSAKLASNLDLLDLLTSRDKTPWVTRLHGIAPIVETDPRGRLREVLNPTVLYLDEAIRTRHILFVGPTGCGKTTKLALPILRADISDPEKIVIIWDSKGGELLPHIYALVDKHRPGQRVEVIDFLNPERSCGWNPLDALQTEYEVQEFCERLCYATETRPASNDSEFFIRNAVDLLAGIIWSFKCAPSEPCTLAHARHLAEGSLRQLKQHAERFTQIDGLHSFIEYADTGDRNAYTILADLRSRLSLWRDTRICTVTSSNEIKLDEILSRPTVLVLRANEADVRRLRPLTNAFFCELVARLFRLAETSKGGTLRWPVSVLIEEMASSVGRIPDLDRFLSTVRSRRVSITASAQSVSQVRKEYLNEADPLLDGFCTKVFFPDVSITDAEYASSVFGSGSVIYTEKTVQRDRRLGRKAMVIDETRKLVSRPILTPQEIISPPAHRELGGAVTFKLPSVPPFQAFLTPAYMLQQFAPLIEVAMKRDKLGALRPALLSPAKRPAVTLKNASSQSSGPEGFTDTRGWSDEQVRAKLEEERNSLDWMNTTGNARKWWDAFENENKHRLSLVLRLAEELRNRKATITEFFLSYVYSSTDNIQANLYYLDYTRLKKEEERKKKEAAAKAREAASLAPSAPPSMSGLLPNAPNGGATAPEPADAGSSSERHRASSDPASDDLTQAADDAPSAEHPAPKPTAVKAEPAKKKPKARQKRSRRAAEATRH